MPERIRLDKLLAHAGLGTRTQVQALIRAGRVTQNGVALRDAALKLPADTPHVCLDGAPIFAAKHAHYLLHKPAGVLTAARDAHAATVLDLFPESLRRGLSPVGRLDKQTTGLLLLTTDGQLAHRLISPRFEVEKIYEARVEGSIDESDIAAFARGIALSDFTALPARLRETAHARDGASRVEVCVREGKYHQVRRMLGARGKPVLELHRTRVGPIALPCDLPPGEYRPLTREEIRALYALVRLEEE